jgi:hypothetical protein
MTASQSACLVGRELLDGNAGIVDQHADRPKRRFRGIDGLADRGDIGDVQLHGRGAAALAPDLLFQAFELRGLARRQHDGSAMRGQDARELPSQPLAGAGNEDGFFTNVE